MSKSRKKSALFLDRDGVINHDTGHLYKAEDFVFLDGIFDLCLSAKAENLLIVIITNQAGIGRGFYSEADFHKLSNWVNAEFAAKGIEITDTYYCPYHPTHGIGAYRKDSLRRKPAPGMVLEACRDHGIDPKSSLFVGDKESDMAAGRAAGVGLNILYAPDQAAARKASQDLTVKSLREIVPILQNFCRGRA